MIIDGIEVLNALESRWEIWDERFFPRQMLELLNGIKVVSNNTGATGKIHQDSSLEDFFVGAGFRGWGMCKEHEVCILWDKGGLSFLSPEFWSNSISLFVHEQSPLGQIVTSYRRHLNE